MAATIQLPGEVGEDRLLVCLGNLDLRVDGRPPHLNRKARNPYPQPQLGVLVNRGAKPSHSLTICLPSRPDDLAFQLYCVVSV